MKELTTKNKFQILFLIIVFFVLLIIIYPIVLFILYKYSVINIVTNYSFFTIFKAFQYQSTHAVPALLYSAVLSVILMISFYFLSLNKKNANIHGNARFANDKEIQKFKDAKSGIVIGIHKNKLLRFPGQQFVALGAPTRSGKGVGIVIPNLLEQTDSMVVMDIPKLEAFTQTSRYRKQILGQEIYLFAPFKKGTSKYNPLDYVDFSGDLADVQLTAIASIIYNQGKDPFFEGQAVELFVGIALFVNDLINKGLLKMPLSIATILECSTLINDEPFEDYYNNIKLQTDFNKGGILRIERYLSTSANTRSSIKASFEGPLAIFGSNQIAKNTNFSDFNFNDVRKKKMTIYISLTLEELLQARGLINLFFSQLLTENTRKLPEQDPTLKHPCILLLDEFTSIGQIEILKKGSAFIAGYNLRMLTIFQSISQLEEPPPAGYGKEGARSLLTNHACQIIYAPKEQKDANEYSERLGYKDVIDNSISRSSKNIDRNISENKQKRALMLPQEIKEMPFQDEIIFIENNKPIKCNKAFYFSVPELINKLKKVSPTLRAVDKPTKKEFDAAFQKGECAIQFKELSKSK